MDLAPQFGGRFEIETVNITDVSQIAALKSRLTGRGFDLRFVNAGVTNPDNETIWEISTEGFTRILVTNALLPMRVVEELAENITTNGTIGVISSGEGSVANNETVGFEVYRASKAALNTLVEAFGHDEVVSGHCC